MKFLKMSISLKIEMAQQVPDSEEARDLKNEPEFNELLDSLRKEYEATFAAQGGRLVDVGIDAISIVEV